MEVAETDILNIPITREEFDYLLLLMQEYSREPISANIINKIIDFKQNEESATKIFDSTYRVTPIVGD